MKKLIVAAVVLAGLVPAARAEFYIGASLTSTASDFEAAAENFESDELGWKAYAGWDFAEYFGIEAGYRDLGNFSEGEGTASIDLDLEVIDAAARVRLPLSDIFQLYGKLGYANIAWDGEIDIENQIENFDEDDWELFYGVGAQVNLGRNFAIRAEWEMYDVSDDLSTLSAGLAYRF